MEDIEVKPKKKKEAEPVFEAEYTVKPAKEKKPAEKKAKQKAATETPWWSDGRISKITGLGLMMLSFMMAVAFTSYLFTVADDQSEVFNGGLATLADNSIHAKNALGRLGALMAHLFINNLFGLSSYVFVIMSFVAGFNLLMRKAVFPALKIAIYSLVVAVWLSTALAFGNWLIYPIVYYHGAALLATT